MRSFPVGANVIFTARTGKKFDGVVKGIATDGKVVVQLGDDPFPVELGVDKLNIKEYTDTMATKTATKPVAKRATKAAAAAPRTRRTKTVTAVVEDDAPAPAKRAAKKVAAKKAAPAAAKRTNKSDPDTWPVPGKNPYRPGSNLFKITDVLLKGGKRSAHVVKLQRVIDMHPYTQVKDDLDIEKELDKRVMLTAGLLERDFGFTIEKAGRGMDNGTIKVVPPA